MKYSNAITFFLIGIISLFLFTKISSAQIITPQLSSQQIPFIDPTFAQEATKHTRSIDLCPPTNGNCSVSYLCKTRVGNDGLPGMAAPTEHFEVDNSRRLNDLLPKVFIRGNPAAYCRVKDDEAYEVLLLQSVEYVRG